MLTWIIDASGSKADITAALSRPYDEIVAAKNELVLDAQARARLNPGRVDYAEMAGQAEAELAIVSSAPARAWYEKAATFGATWLASAGDVRVGVTIRLFAVEGGGFRFDFDATEYAG